ncbi:hypothetical protein C0431_07370 [bacterium]|nr:hypothetical protein [bacterium]
MSEAKRAYNVLRAFVNNEWERVKGLDLQNAWRELDAPIGEQPHQTEEQANPISSMEPTELEANARTILNVTAKASFDEIRKAFEKINHRVQPQNFESGTDEARHAQELLRKATWAYQYLTKDMSAAERRFRSLELD